MVGEAGIRQLVGLIQRHQIPRSGRKPFRYPVGLAVGDDDNFWFLGAISLLLIIIQRRNGKRELVDQLIMSMVNQGWRAKDKQPMPTLQRSLQQGNPSLNRFTKSLFVGQNDAIPVYGAAGEHGGIDLVRMQIKVRGKQGRKQPLHTSVPPRQQQGEIASVVGGDWLVIPHASLYP